MTATAPEVSCPAMEDNFARCFGEHVNETQEDHSESIPFLMTALGPLVNAERITPAGRESPEAIPAATPKAEALKIARKLVDAHLRKFSSHSSNTISSDAQAAESLPSQHNDPLTGRPDHDSNDSVAQEGLLGIIMDVCKLHVNDAIHDFQRPAGPFRSSTFGKISFRERKPSFLDLDSGDEDDDYEPPSASTSQSPLSGANHGDKLRPLPLRVDSRSKSKDLNDQWANEKEQTRTHLTEIIRSHISRHIYLIRLCRALMLYGAPTHRLEE